MPTFRYTVVENGVEREAAIEVDEAFMASMARAREFWTRERNRCRAPGGIDACPYTRDSAHDPGPPDSYRCRRCGALLQVG